MKVELKPIIDQLTEAICLKEGFKVCAIIDDNDGETITGWGIVSVDEDGTITPSCFKFNNLKELLNAYL